MFQCIMDTCIMDTSIMYISTWVTRPEHPKGAKGEVKEARRAKSRPEGPQTRTSSLEYYWLCISFNINLLDFSHLMKFVLQYCGT